MPETELREAVARALWQAEQEIRRDLEARHGFDKYPFTEHTYQLLHEDWLKRADAAILAMRRTHSDEHNDTIIKKSIREEGT